MIISLASAIRTAAESVGQSTYWAKKLAEVYGIGTSPETDHNILRQTYRAMSVFPPALARECGITKMVFRTDMGPNKPYYPNHGYFINHTVALNADIFMHPDQPDDFMDHRGWFLTRPDQTLYHEFGHGYDQYHGDLSLKPEWLQLSQWSETKKPGLKRIIIRDKGAPEKVGEWWYGPEAKFTRFYAKTNPWDDWADCFAFYVGGLRENVPGTKQEYFDKLFAPHYA